MNRDGQNEAEMGRRSWRTLKKILPIASYLKQKNPRAVKIDRKAVSGPQRSRVPFAHVCTTVSADADALSAGSWRTGYVRRCIVRRAGDRWQAVRERDHLAGLRRTRTPCEGGRSGVVARRSACAGKEGQATARSGRH